MIVEAFIALFLHFEFLNCSMQKQAGKKPNIRKMTCLKNGKIGNFAWAIKSQNGQFGAKIQST